MFLTFYSTHNFDHLNCHIGVSHLWQSQNDTLLKPSICKYICAWIVSKSNLILISVGMAKNARLVFKNWIQ